MYKFSVIVLALAIIMTGCSATANSYFFDRADYIEDLVNAHTMDSADVAPRTHLTSEGTASSASTSSIGARQRSSQRELITSYQVLCAFNEVRAAYGLSALEYNQELERGAHIRAKEASDQFCHYRPDGSPCVSVSRLADGEILARRSWSSDLDDLINGWMGSQPHKESILMPYDMEVGIGVYYDNSDQTVYWAALFHIVD